MSMKKIRTRSERKMAARLMISMAKTHGVWSDGQHIYRGDALKSLLKKALDRLVNDVSEKLPPHDKKANAVLLVSMIAKNPEIHGFPKSVPAMLSARAWKLRQDAAKNVPGAMEHFVVTRRLAVRAGTLLPGLLRLPSEEAAAGKRIEEAKFLRTKEEILLENGEVCPVGTLLRRDEHDGALVTPGGDVIWEDGVKLIDMVRIVKEGRAERSLDPSL